MHPFHIAQSFRYYGEDAGEGDMGVVVELAGSVLMADSTNLEKQLTNILLVEQNTFLQKLLTILSLEKRKR